MREQEKEIMSQAQVEDYDRRIGWEGDFSDAYEEAVE